MGYFKLLGIKCGQFQYSLKLPPCRPATEHLLSLDLLLPTTLVDSTDLLLTYLSPLVTISQPPMLAGTAANRQTTSTREADRLSVDSPASLPLDPVLSHPQQYRRSSMVTLLSCLPRHSKEMA